MLHIQGRLNVTCLARVLSVWSANGVLLLDEERPQIAPVMGSRDSNSGRYLKHKLHHQLERDVDIRNKCVSVAKHDNLSRPNPQERQFQYVWSQLGANFLTMIWLDRCWALDILDKPTKCK